MSSKPVLKIDWATYEAAKFAVMRWHYSKRVPKNKLVKIGVWEDDQFIGVVIFGMGASDSLGSIAGLTCFETSELVRIALKEHVTPVTRIVKIAFAFLRKACPRIRLCVSFADPSQGHHGGIYQGGGWIYCGQSEPSDEYIVNGVRMHGRAIRKTMERYIIPGKNTLERIRAWRDPMAVQVDGVAKYRYLMPLDDAMRDKIAPLAKPYPKSTRVKKQDSGHPSELGGAVPTDALHSHAR